MFVMKTPLGGLPEGVFFAVGQVLRKYFPTGCEASIQLHWTAINEGMSRLP